MLKNDFSLNFGRSFFYFPSMLAKKQNIGFRVFPIVVKTLSRSTRGYLLKKFQANDKVLCFQIFFSYRRTFKEE